MRRDRGLIYDISGKIVGPIKPDTYTKSMMKTYIFLTTCLQAQNSKINIKEVVALIIRNKDKTPIIYDQIQIY